MLREGGNAVDAAIATAITLTVVEPNNNGIGSDAFALIHDGTELHGLNASGRSPEGLHAERFRGLNQMPSLGWDSVTVPGAVSAWVEMSEKFGRLPFARLFEPAICYARDGFQVGPKSGFFWHHAVKQFQAFPTFIETFTKNGRAPHIGERMCLPDHATSLELIAESKGESFYQGKLAEMMMADAQTHHAAMTKSDFANHRCEWVEPISIDAFDASLHEIPPNGQGLMALISLGILRHRHEDFSLDSADSVHLQIEAQRIAYAEAQRHLADIAHMRVSVEELLDPDYLERRSREIDMSAANPNPTALGAAEDTVYLSTADSQGMMVSMIQSNFRGFGSGIVVPGTGISLQNRGSGFVLEPGHPNEVGPSKRPYQTIIPGFITRDNNPFMSFGVMGGHMQAQGHLQMMIRIMNYRQNPQAASDAPRWYVFEDGRVALEKGFDAQVAEELHNRGHTLVMENPEYLFGGAQLIAKLDDGYVGGSDHRKEGLVSGF
jgi:gamma-glutamyltranspeptidase/glutathione hydrolase